MSNKDQILSELNDVLGYAKAKQLHYAIRLLEKYIDFINAVEEVEVSHPAQLSLFVSDHFHLEDTLKPPGEN